jgi:ubiquinone biosynthesis protein
MTPRHPAFDYFQRLFQILRIVSHQLALLAVRRFRKQPTLGHLLLRDGLEQIGGCFVKLGQILSLQIDTLPREYCDALLSLLDRVPTCTSEEVSGVFAKEFGRGPEALYAEFDFVAVGSASIGQVHKGILHDGAKVAIKVQRPGVRYAFRRDILLMRSFVWMIFLFRVRSLYFMRDPVRELSTWTRDELDYRREASHADMVRANAVDTPTERIPKIFWDLTRSRVLTMEFLEGPSVLEYLRLVENNETRALAELANAGFDASVFCGNVITNFLSDAFRHGVFHADLHPANLLILPNNVVGYVDFGIVAKLTREARHKQIELNVAFSEGDPEEIYRQFLNIIMLTPDSDLEGMRRGIAKLSQTWYEEPAVRGKVRLRVSITIVMRDFLIVCRNYGVLVDREMIKYIRSIVLVDGVVSRLAPGFDLALLLRKVVEDYLFEEARRKMFSEAGTTSLLADLAIWMKTGPASMLRALEHFERRQISFKTKSAQETADHRPLRVRAVAGMTVWALTIVFLSLGGGSAAMHSSPFWRIVIGVFVSSWTVWLLYLLHRLARRT